MAPSFENLAVPRYDHSREHLPSAAATTRLQVMQNPYLKEIAHLLPPLRPEHEEKGRRPLTMAWIREQWTLSLMQYADFHILDAISTTKRLLRSLRLPTDKLSNRTEDTGGSEEWSRLLTRKEISLLYVNLGLMHGYLGSYHMAASCFSEAMKLCESLAITSFALGIAQFYLGSFRHSKRSFRSCGRLFEKEDQEGRKVGISFDVWPGETSVAETRDCNNDKADAEEDDDDDDDDDNLNRLFKRALINAHLPNNQWTLAWERVEWNLRHAITERNHLYSGTPRPGNGRWGLNGIPFGVIFGPPLTSRALIKQGYNRTISPQLAKSILERNFLSAESEFGGDEEGGGGGNSEKMRKEKKRFKERWVVLAQKMPWRKGEVESFGGGGQGTETGMGSPGFGKGKRSPFFEGGNTVIMSEGDLVPPVNAGAWLESEWVWKRNSPRAPPLPQAPPPPPMVPLLWSPRRSTRTGRARVESKVREIGKIEEADEEDDEGNHWLAQHHRSSIQAAQQREYARIIDDSQTLEQDFLELLPATRYVPPASKGPVQYDLSRINDYGGDYVPGIVPLTVGVLDESFHTDSISTMSSRTREAMFPSLSSPAPQQHTGLSRRLSIDAVAASQDDELSADGSSPVSPTNAGQWAAYEKLIGRPATPEVVGTLPREVLVTVGSMADGDEGGDDDSDEDAVSLVPSYYRGELPGSEGSVYGGGDGGGDRGDEDEEKWEGGEASGVLEEEIQEGRGKMTRMSLWGMEVLGEWEWEEKYGEWICGEGGEGGDGMGGEGGDEDEEDEGTEMLKPVCFEGFGARLNR